VNDQNALAKREEARLASLTGNHGDAYRIYEELLTVRPDDPRTLLDYARAKYREYVDLEGATRLFERLAEVESGSVEAQLWLGDLYSLGYGRGYQAAADRYRAALHLDARAADAYVGLGMLHRVPSTPVTLPEAIDAFRTAVELEPGRADARADLGMALLEAGQPDSARRELMVAVRLLEEAGEARQAKGVRAMLEAVDSGRTLMPGGYSNRSPRFRWPRAS
jgi:tetratricopeptide (TPR) repeat protein